jgi:hypothetical protein
VRRLRGPACLPRCRTRAVTQRVEGHRGLLTCGVSCRRQLRAQCLPARDAPMCGAGAAAPALTPAHQSVGVRRLRGASVLPVWDMAAVGRGLAQPGSASALGAGGRCPNPVATSVTHGRLGIAVRGHGVRPQLERNDGTMKPAIQKPHSRERSPAAYTRLDSPPASICSARPALHRGAYPCEPDDLERLIRTKRRLSRLDSP